MGKEEDLGDCPKGDKGKVDWGKAWDNEESKGIYGDCMEDKGMNVGAWDGLREFSVGQWMMVCLKKRWSFFQEF